MEVDFQNLQIFSERYLVYETELIPHIIFYTPAIPPFHRPHRPSSN